MMSIDYKRNGPMIMCKRKCCSVMGVRFFAAGIVLACLDCLHSSLEDAFSFAQIMK